MITERMEGRVNCLSHVYCHFRIIPTERFVSPIGTNLGKHFELVNDVREARVVAILPRGADGLDVPPHHVALFSLGPGTQMWVEHRPADDEPVVKEPLDYLIAEYRGFPFVFLKPKQKVPVPA
jgi:hypothetical protein